MTRKDLSQLWWLNREIEAERNRLAALTAAAESTVGCVSGLPHAGAFSDKNALAAEIAEIADSRAIIDAKLRASVAEYNRLTRWIAAVDDSLMRQILRLRYIDGQSWTAVAVAVGGGNTVDSVKKAVYRFLKK